MEKIPCKPLRAGIWVGDADFGSRGTSFHARAAAETELGRRDALTRLCWGSHLVLDAGKMCVRFCLRDSGATTNAHEIKRQRKIFVRLWRVAVKTGARADEAVCGE